MLYLFVSVQLGVLFGSSFAFYRASALFLREMKHKVLILGLKSILCPSFKVIGARSATLAWLEKRKKERKNMKNPVLHTLSSSASYACLITLFIILSSCNGAPKCLYTLRMPERTRLMKFWRVYCFGLSMRVTGSFPIFCVIPTYEVLAYFMIQKKINVNNNIFLFLSLILEL